MQFPCKRDAFVWNQMWMRNTQLGTFEELEFFLIWLKTYYKYKHTKIIFLEFQIDTKSQLL